MDGKMVKVSMTELRLNMTKVMAKVEAGVVMQVFRYPHGRPAPGEERAGALIAYIVPAQQADAVPVPGE